MLNKLYQITEQDEETKRLIELAYQALEEVSKEIAKQRKVQYHNIIPLEALREIATKLPITKAEFLKIPNVTNNVYDDRYLKVTKLYKQMLNEQNDMKNNDDGLFEGDIEMDGDNFNQSNHQSIDFDDPDLNNQPTTSYAPRGKSNYKSKGYSNYNNSGGSGYNNGGGFPKKRKKQWLFQ